MTNPTKTGFRHDGQGEIVAVIWARLHPKAWLETVYSVLALEGVTEVYVCFEREQPGLDALFADSRIVLRVEKSLARIIDDVLTTEAEQIALVIAPIVAAPETLTIAADWMARDPRIGTVSFLSNAAGYLSFPYRNKETPTGLPKHSERSLTRVLRERTVGPTPISTPEGAVALICRSALVVCNGFADSPDGEPQTMVAEFGLRASRRGFNNYLDANTYVTRPMDGIQFEPTRLKDDRARSWLNSQHHFFPGLHDYERIASTSPLAQALDVARAKAVGLRVLIDGSALGPQELGTQHHIIALCIALAQENSVSWLGVGVPDPNNLPAYAQIFRSISKINLLQSGALTFPDSPTVDILHRPFQPYGLIPWDRWRSLAKRTVITILDLIAYKNGSYFRTWEEWQAYRENLVRQVSQASGIFSISHDVDGSVSEERLPIDRDAMFVVENGIDFYSADAPAHVPFPLLEKGLSASAFLVVLGATYAHKNRDFAIRIWLELKRRNHKVALVLVGASIAYGTSRIEEAQLIKAGLDDLVVLPDVSSEERNWLLKHSSLVIYTTAAEGFGFIPFEAAEFGRPALHVSFGPLRELIEDPEVPRVFDVDLLADRAELLLTDPAAAARAVRAVRSKAGGLSWRETARKSVDAYFHFLGRPARQ